MNSTLLSLIIFWGIIGLIALINWLIDLYKKPLKEKDKIILEREATINQYQQIIQEREINLKQYELLNQNQKLEFDKMNAEMKLQSQQQALQQFETFKNTELAAMKKVIEENALTSAVNLLQKWKVENEAKIRQDAANRSFGVQFGKVSEHFYPFHVKFPFNPKDARFVGSPIDLLVFDGLEENRDYLDIYFVEIKTGKSGLSSRQKKIKEAVDQRRIIWYDVNISDI